MTLYNYLNANMKRVKYECKIGILPCSILRHWEIFGRYDAAKKMGMTTTDAVYFVAEKMKVSTSSVFKIINRMEKEV